MNPDLILFAAHFFIATNARILIGFAFEEDKGENCLDGAEGGRDCLWIGYFEKLVHQVLGMHLLFDVRTILI